MDKTKIILTFAILFFGFFGLAESSLAATYYVSTGGSDTNPGSQSQPWRTIQKAANTVIAGDTAVVISGTYDERITFISQHSGAVGNKITFRAEPRRSAVINGFNTTNAGYLRIEGFEITHNIGGWLGGGIWLSSNGVEIVDNYFHDIPGPAISSNWQAGVQHDNIYVADNKMYKVNKGVNASGSNWLVENNEVERLYRFDVMEGSPYGEDADYSRFFGENITFRKNYFHGTLQSEIGTSHTDGFQTFSNNDGFARNIVIEGNIVDGFFHQGMMMEGRRLAEGFSHQNITVRNNVFADSASWGIAAHGINNLVVVNNVFAKAGIAIGFRNSKDDTFGAMGTTGVIKNNIFMDTTAVYYAENLSSYVDGYNLIYNCRDNPNPGSATNIIGTNPMFFDQYNIAGTDGVPFTGDDGFALKAESPAVNAGVNLAGTVDNDILGSFRPQGSGWDIGAYEYVSGAPADTTPPSAPQGLAVL